MRLASKNEELLQQPAFYPELCSTSRPNVFSRQVLSTLSQQQQAGAEDGTRSAAAPSSSNQLLTVRRGYVLITKHFNNTQNVIRPSLKKKGGKTTFLIGHSNLTN